MIEQPTTKAWRDLTLGSTEAVGESLASDADWTPVILMHCDEGFRIMPMIIDLEDEVIDISGQEGLPQVAAAIHEMKPQIISRVQMAWASQQRDTRPSEAIDRKEILTVLICSATEIEFWTAEVDREGKHPRLLEWKRADATAGPIADATRVLMQTVSRQN